jgi:hypothetical protein
VTNYADTPEGFQKMLEDGPKRSKLYMQNQSNALRMPAIESRVSKADKEPESGKDNAVVTQATVKTVTKEPEIDFKSAAAGGDDGEREIEEDFVEDRFIDSDRTPE